MFEKGKPVPQAAQSQSADPVAPENGPREGALRLIDWNELTARLNATRDLRELLRQDETQGISAASGSFADAAARYFRTCEERGEENRSDQDWSEQTDDCDDPAGRDQHSCEPGQQRERGVNPVALEHSKRSPGIAIQSDGAAPDEGPSQRDGAIEQNEPHPREVDEDGPTGFDDNTQPGDARED